MIASGVGAVLALIHGDLLGGARLSSMRHVDIGLKMLLSGTLPMMIWIGIHVVRENLRYDRPVPAQNHSG